MLSARERLLQTAKSEIVTARLLGLSYPTDWEHFLRNNSPEFVAIVVEALGDEGLLKLLVHI